jgi:hypothetical protein
VLGVGDHVPVVSVWTAPREQARVGELHADRAILLLFYLFDWSST